MSDTPTTPNRREAAPYVPAAPRQGEPITSRFLISLREAAVTRILPPRQIERESDSPGQDATPISGTVAIERGTVTSESTNTLTVSLASSGTTTVAKPFILRGSTSTRTVSGEAQEILPTYSSGSVIAANVGATHTGITGVSWIDLNVDGRMWAESAT